MTRQFAAGRQFSVKVVGHRIETGNFLSQLARLMLRRKTISLKRNAFAAA